MSRLDILTLSVVLFIIRCDALLDVQELTNTKYTLDILSLPLNEVEINLAEGLKLASRHGQRYHCMLPVPVEDTLKQEETIPRSTPVSLLLEPLRQEDCLKTVKGWWTYEFCYGKYVKQYHQEGDILKAITYLGYYESDFDWNKESKDDSLNFKQHKLSRYHSQRYVNGTACDVINHNRDTEIRYICDDSSTETYIERVDEPSTCSYILTVHTPFICSHPHTSLIHERKPIAITCRPLLSSDDYKKFEETKAAEKEHFRTEIEPHSLPADMEKHFYPKKNLERASRESYPEDAITEIQAVGMIERFIMPDRLQNMKPFQQKRLVMDVVDLMRMNNHLPTADQARIVQKHVSRFVTIVEALSEVESEGKEYQQNAISDLNNKLMDDVSNMPLPNSADDDEIEKKSSRPVTIHVKVHKLKRGEKLDGAGTEDAHFEDHPVNNDPTLKKLENDIGKELQDAGFEAEEGHIEIRLVTNSEALDLDSDNEDRLRQMLFELVAGGTALKNEVKKQKALHDNYSMVWEKDSSTFTSASSFDEDSDNNVKSPKR